MEIVNHKKIFQIATKAVIKNNLEQILVIKKSVDEKINDACYNLFDLPGGRLEYSENLEEALSREIKEETNLIIKDMHIIDAASILRDDGIQLIIITYLCHSLEIQCILSSEHTEYFWLDKQTILNSYQYPDWLKTIINKID